jgi:hypothetical protein
VERASPAERHISKSDWPSCIEQGVDLLGSSTKGSSPSLLRVFYGWTKRDGTKGSKRGKEREVGLNRDDVFVHPKDKDEELREFKFSCRLRV